MTLQAESKVKVGAIRAVVTRANGTVENRGIVSYTNSNPLLHYPVNAWILVKAVYWRWKEWKDGRTSPK